MERYSRKLMKINLATCIELSNSEAEHVSLERIAPLESMIPCGGSEQKLTGQVIVRLYFLQRTNGQNIKESSNFPNNPMGKCRREKTWINGVGQQRVKIIRMFKFFPHF